MSILTVNISDKIATITLNRPASLNALTSEDYEAFAGALREIDERDDVVVTIWQATGRWFCAGTDVRFSKTAESKGPGNLRDEFQQRVFRTTTDCGKALYSHTKVLVAVLNGPVMGIAAALLGHFDFIYGVPHVWLAVPFTFLGIVAEGGSSVTFVNRMGVATANEVLLWGKKKDASDLLRCGFLNEIFPQQSAESLHAAVRSRVIAELEGLDSRAVLRVKSLLRAGIDEKNNPDAVNLRESYAQAQRFASGTPALRFRAIANKELRHKL